MVITDLNLLSVEELEMIANVLGVFTVIENGRIVRLERGGNDGR